MTFSLLHSLLILSLCQVTFVLSFTTPIIWRAPTTHARARDPSILDKRFRPPVTNKPQLTTKRGQQTTKPHGPQSTKKPNIMLTSTRKANTVRPSMNTNRVSGPQPPLQKTTTKKPVIVGGQKLSTKIRPVATTIEGDVVRASDMLIPDEVTIELAVFHDYHQWIRAMGKYGQDEGDSFLKRYTSAVVGNSQILSQVPSMNPKIHYRIVHYEVWKTNIPEMCDICIAKDADNEVGDKILSQFTKYISNKKLKWDAAVLFTGKDLATMSGISNIGTICTHSATSLVVGTFVGASVLAHELGHTLGMSHVSGSAMDPGGKAGSRAEEWYWASENIEQFHDTLNMLDITKNNCLKKETYAPVLQVYSNPGEEFSGVEQCHWNYGDGAYLDPGKESQLCSRFPCTLNLFFVVLFATQSLALEGTRCGSGGQCSAGLCTDS